jgi:TRAP-type C4-dicarboxylate transport system, periplasmic component
MKDEIASKKLSRRQILKAGAVGAALPLFSILTRPANAAEFTYKFATGQDPSHPVNKRAQEAIDRIRNATNGRMEIKLFPANQLGSDTDLMSQIRNGGVEFFNQANTVLSTLVPAAGIVNTGFAFQDYAAVWKAMDGPLGAHVRAQIEKVGLLTMSKPWDNGFRQITTSTKAIRSAADVKGLKLRVPAAPMLTSLFSALGASPTPINFNEVYSSLQTKLVEGAGKSAGHHQHRTALRSAEVLHALQSRLGRLLDSRQPPRLRQAAQGHPGDRPPRTRSGRHR